MRKQLALVAPVLLGSAILAAPAFAQSQVYEPQYNLAYDRLAEVSEEITAVDTELGQATDAESGCRLLNASLEKYQEAESLLNDLVEYSERLRWRPQRQSAEERLASVQETIGLRENDIATFCVAQ